MKLLVTTLMMTGITLFAQEVYVDKFDLEPFKAEPSELATTHLEIFEPVVISNPATRLVAVSKNHEIYVINREPQKDCETCTEYAVLYYIGESGKPQAKKLSLGEAPGEIQYRGVKSLFVTESALYIQCWNWIVPLNLNGTPIKKNGYAQSWKITNPGIFRRVDSGWIRSDHHLSPVENASVSLMNDDLSESEVLFSWKRHEELNKPLASRKEQTFWFNPATERYFLEVSANGETLVIRPPYDGNIHLVNIKTKQSQEVRLPKTGLRIDEDWAEDRRKEAEEQYHIWQPSFKVVGRYPDFFPDIRVLSVDQNRVLIATWEKYLTGKGRVFFLNAGGKWIEDKGLNSLILDRVIHLQNGWAYITTWDEDEGFGITRVKASNAEKFIQTHPLTKML